MIKKLTMLAGVTAFSISLAPSLQAVSQQDMAELSMLIATIKSVATKDRNLRDFFLPNETPESMLSKAKSSARVTRLPDVANELNSRLIPALEALLNKPEQPVAVQAPAQAYAQEAIQTKSKPMSDDLELELRKISVYEQEIAQLRSELAALQAREKERLEAEYINFMSLIEQAHKDLVSCDPVVNEVKERLVIYRYDLERMARNISSSLSDVTLYGQIDGAKALFLQHMTNLERGCSDIANMKDQISDACDALAKHAKNKAITSVEVQKKTEQTQGLTRLIVKKTEEMFRLLQSLKRTKELSIQSKFDLERQLELAKAQDRKRKRMEL